ncbi:MAG TPA: amidohydrolase family protein, partial [Myxococcales bacterium]|nr:amidohydrolase family protein [Myxococcales bacterium]
MEHARTLNGVTAHVVDALCEVGEKRIAAMDAAGIDMQVISLTSPGVEQLGAAEAKAIATEANDFMAAGARRYPKRLAAFAALPMVDPVAAAAELDRCVQELGFQGALINGHINGR